MNLLIIKIGALGDVVRTTSIVPVLKSKFKNLKITWITSKESIPYISNIPRIDESYEFHHFDEIKDGFKYDLVLSLEDQFIFANLASYFSSKGSKILGSYVTKDGQITYTENSKHWFGMGLLRPEEIGGIYKANDLKCKNRHTYQWHILKMFNLHKYNYTQPLWPSNALSLKTKRKKQSITDLSVGINTSSGSRWPSKQMSVENTIMLIERLLNSDIKNIFLLGGRAENDRNLLISKYFKGKVKIKNTHGNILDFFREMTNLDVLITSDSLALHVGTAANVYVIGFFGPTSFSEIDLFCNGKKIKADKCLCFYKNNCTESVSCINKLDHTEFITNINERFG